MDTLDNVSSSHRLLCPQERYEKDKDGKVITISSEIHHIISSSYLVATDEGENSNHLNSLLCCNIKNVYCCLACRGEINMIQKTYYFCNHCDGNYHKECVESPSLIHSSDHPRHPLQLLFYSKWFFDQKQCCSCKGNFGILLYYCSICDFIIHPICVKNPTPLTIENRKRHEHTLHYFPRRSALVCDACGLEDNNEYLYVCVLCDFVVHKQCIYIPYVIKTSRHNHRLSFVPNIPYKEWTNCGVCQSEINGDYGKYSCMKRCAYALHSRCAMRSDICDGKELEGKPEEEYENIQMFQEEGDGVIRHLSHPSHQMRLDKKVESVLMYDGNKYCQACMLPFYDDGNVYRCMQCDFILHESCAYLPRMKESVLHVHPLILELDYAGYGFMCRKCYRQSSSGFKYVCRSHGCNWELDTFCASICEPFDYHSHPHPMFITYDEKMWKKCSLCHFIKQQPLNCVKCDFVLCFSCAMFPYKLRYEHDEHLLTFSYEKGENDEGYCCEICEEYINPKKGLYACKKCQVTLHIKCLLGKDPYMKPRPNQSGILSKEMVHVIPNTCLTRPICKTCQRRCAYKTRLESSREGVFCSYFCWLE